MAGQTAEGPGGERATVAVAREETAESPEPQVPREEEQRRSAPGETPEEGVVQVPAGRRAWASEAPLEVPELAAEAALQEWEATALRATRGEVAAPAVLRAVASAARLVLVDAGVRAVQLGRTVSVARQAAASAAPADGF